LQRRPSPWEKKRGERGKKEEREIKREDSIGCMPV
jgi:hypothetical protein